MPRHLRSLLDLSPETVREVLATAGRLKLDTRRGVPRPLLEGQSIAMIFHKPSLRTKVSFQVAMTQLGGASVDLTEEGVGMGKREAVRDVARVLSGYVQGIVIRTFGQELVDEMAEWSRAMILPSAANCFSRALRPTNSFLSGEKLTANLVRGTARMGISLPSGSWPNSWP